MRRILVAAALCVAGGAWASDILEARDLNADGIVDAYYDVTLGITWTADGNLPKTQGIVNDPNFPGAQNLFDSEAWAASLDFFGVTGWRLPKVLTVECFGNSGIPCNAKTSEFDHLDPTPFFNVGLDLPYWTGSEVDSGFHRFGYFDFKSGNATTDETALNMYGWAVHDGDIGTPIPEPETWGLMLGGLLALGARRRNHH